MIIPSLNKSPQGIHNENYLFPLSIFVYLDLTLERKICGLSFPGNSKTYFLPNQTIISAAAELSDHQRMANKRNKHHHTNQKIFHKIHMDLKENYL